MVFNVPECYAVQEGDATMMLNKKKPGQKILIVKAQSIDVKICSKKKVPLK